MRPSPEDWTWVKTVAEAKDQILAWINAGDEWTHASLDHDLGAVISGHVADLYLAGNSNEGSGYDLVEWMCDEERLPTEGIRIHSWNPGGAHRMAYLLEAHVSYKIEVTPYVV